MIPNPWVIVGILVIWAASLAGAYYKGGEHREAAIIAAAAKDAQAAQERATEVARLLEAKKGKRRALDRDIDTEVNLYAQTDAARADCLDDSGLRLIQAIARGELPTSGPPALPDRTAKPPEREAWRTNPSR